MSDEVVLKKTRGRPPGSIRDVFFVIGAMNNNEMLMKQIKSTRGEDISEDDMRTEAEEIFSSQFNLEPKVILGPFFEAKLTQTSTNKRESIRISEENINYTKRKANAIYGDWHVFARYIEDENGMERPDVVQISFKKEVNPGAKPKTPPRTTFKFISELTDISEI